MLREQLLGTWKLMSFQGTDEAGNTHDMMGEDATGFLCYSPDGWVCVGIMREGRPDYDVPDMELGSDEQTLAAARGMFSYAGQFEVDEENSIVYHNLEFSLIPNWVGSRQKRYVRLEDNDNLLILTADPVKFGKDGKKRITRLVWGRN